MTHVSRNTQIQPAGYSSRCVTLLRYLGISEDVARFCIGGARGLSFGALLSIFPTCCKLRPASTMPAAMAMAERQVAKRILFRSRLMRGTRGTRQRVKIQRSSLIAVGKSNKHAWDKPSYNAGSLGLITYLTL